MRRAAALCALGLLGASGAGAHDPSHRQSARNTVPGPPSTMVTWLYKPREIRDLVRHADKIVVAAFDQSRQGRSARSGSEGATLQFELNEFFVEEVLKGNSNESGIAVERLRSMTVPGLAEPVPVAIVGEGGAFIHGQRYLLFLKKQRSSETYYVINDESRYELSDEERLHLRSDGGPVGNQLRGRPWPQMRAVLQSLLPR